MSNTDIQLIQETLVDGSLAIDALDRLVAERTVLQSRVTLLESDLCDYENRDKAHIFSINELIGSNNALTARVESLKEALIFYSYDAPYHEHDGCSMAREVLNSTPVANLAALAERVKRETVEAIIAADDSDELTSYRRPTRDDYYRAAGIEPSTETEGEK